MNLIEPKAELLLQSEGLEGVYKQIELCGRTCYKSTDKMAESTAKPFVDRMITNHHTAMLEHGTVYLHLQKNAHNCTETYNYSSAKFTTHYNWSDVVGHIQSKYKNSPYSKVVYRLDGMKNNPIQDYYITTNYRHIIENNWLDDLQFICEPTEFHEKRYTFKFTCSRAIAQELTRHRVFSFAMESQRYCNYNKDRFNNEITFIEPSFTNSDKVIKSEAFDNAYEVLCSSFEEAEGYYQLLIESGFDPQEARDVLPNATKTEICMTGFASDWKYLFDLRLYDKTGKSHPDMKLLVSKAKDEFIKNNLWDSILKYPSKFD